MRKTVQIKKFIKSGSMDDPSCYKLINCKIGDWVCFKSDYEQSGQIKDIRSERRFVGNVTVLDLHNDNGFGGEYLRYARNTVVDADDCWL